jgi:hypothetical protein
MLLTITLDSLFPPPCDKEQRSVGNSRPELVGALKVVGLPFRLHASDRCSRR